MIDPGLTQAGLEYKIIFDAFCTDTKYIGWFLNYMMK